MRGYRGNGGGVNLITENPVLGGISDANTIIGQQDNLDYNKLRYDEARRTADAEHAVDEALRGYVGGLDPATGQPAQPGAQQPGVSLQGENMPPMPGATFYQNIPPARPGEGGAIQPIPNARPGEGGTIEPIPNAPIGPGVDMNQVFPGPVQQPKSPVRTGAAFDRLALAKRLSSVPGGGAAAIQQVETADTEQRAASSAAAEKQDHAVTNFFKALDAGDHYSAHYWSQQAGMNVPEEAFKDADFNKFMTTAGKWKDFYGSDLKGFQGFMRDALKLHTSGDPAAFQSAFQANPPTAPAGPKNSYDDKFGAIDRLMKPPYNMTRDQAMAQIFPQGGRRGASGAGGGGVYEFKYNKWLEAHPGDQKGALEYASGRKTVGHAQAIHWAIADAAKEDKERGLPDGESMDQAIERYRKMYEDPASGSDAGGAPDTPPSLSPRLPDENAPYQAKLNGKTIRSNDGETWFDEDGNAVE